MSGFSSPWLTLKEAATYAKRGRRFLRAQVEQGHLRAAIVGGRKEILTRSEWIDQWLEDMARPVMVSSLRRGSR